MYKLMKTLTVLSTAEQVAEHLRAELLRGELSGMMPGVNPLVAELGVNHKTVKVALRILEDEGLLVNQGRGLQRRIVLPENITPPSLRLAILLYEKDDASHDFMIHLLHRVNEAGHTASFATKTLLDLEMNLSKVKRFVKKTEADAWVIFAGSRELLEWFAAQPEPAMALAGRRRGIRIASTGPDKVPAEKTAVRRLVELGHRRIVMLAREDRRKPHPGLMERAFLEELEAQGIQTGSYNLPDWEDSPEGLRRCLDSLFQHTPPTALVIDSVPIFLAVERHLTQLGFLAPQDVSLICLDPSPNFIWFQPSVAHINWDSRLLVQRIVRWAHNVALGKDDRRQSSTKATFVDGGTVGPALGKK
jgi:DNA-binding LacI/PurR family transcriptional regulator